MLWMSLIGGRLVLPGASSCLPLFPQTADDVKFIRKVLDEAGGTSVSGTSCC